MNAAKSLIAALFLAAASLASVSHAGVIDFNGEAGAGGFASYNYGKVYSQGGFALSNQVYAFVIGSAYEGNTDSNDFAFNGSDYLVAYSATTLVSETAKPFKITSIDLALYMPYSGDLRATLTGSKIGGGTVTQTVDLDALANGDKINGNDFTTYSLVGFDNLSSLTISNSFGYFLAMDNLVMDATSTSAVPEPSSIALFGLAIAAGAFARRRAVKAA
jgi:hypothetical protein